MTLSLIRCNNNVTLYHKQQWYETLQFNSSDHLLLHIRFLFNYRKQWWGTLLYNSIIPCVDISLIRNDLHEDFEVKENTVGQFTGLTDKNGTKMFEGDILDYGISKNHVVFLEGSFGIINQSEQGSSFGSYDIDNGVIIGNIHDNPELKWKEDRF